MPEKKKFDVLVAGELNVDIILDNLNQFPAMGKEVLAEDLTLTLGSSSAIFASNLSVLGTSVAFAGRVGQDYFGQYIVERLQARGVDTSPVISGGERSTGVTIALSGGEDRAMVTYPGAMSLFTLADIPEHLFTQCRHLHVSSIFLSRGLKKDLHALFRKAKQSGMTTSLDPQWDPDERWDIDFSTLLADVDVFLPNESELCAMAGNKDLAAAVEEFRRVAQILIVKRGRHGADLYKGQERIRQAAFLNDRVVDSIGAGDSFGSGFIHSLVQGKDLRECLEVAAVAGAVNTTRAGGTAAFDSLDTVRQIARSSFNYIL